MTGPPVGCLRLFLAGDVMTGRGIDQILPHPGDPTLYENFVASAEGYVALAENRVGPIRRPVPPAYIWGDLADDLAQANCDARIVNLETTITTANEPEPKGINYRMSPANMPALVAGEIDASGLANNHVLDWGPKGLFDTLAALDAARIAHAGAGRDLPAAARPALIDRGHRGRVLLVAYGAASSGIPRDWTATATRPGVNLLPDRADDLLPALRRLLEPVRRPGDVVVASIHWGGNWGFDVPAAQSALADRLTKEGRVDVVMGHSSHHPKEVMVMNGKLVLFGCGDLINDYEGIGGHQTFLPDVAVGYVIDLSVSDGALWQVDALVYERRAFRLQRAGPELRDRVLPILAKDFPGKVSAAGANRLRFLP